MKHMSKIYVSQENDNSNDIAMNTSEIQNSQTHICNRVFSNIYGQTKWGHHFTNFTTNSDLGDIAISLLGLNTDDKCWGRSGN